MNQFPFLYNQILPKMVAEGLKLMGTAEIPGPKSNAEIIRWALETGLSNVYLNDDTAWCGLFMAVVAQRAGREVVEDPLWARNWAKFGLKAHVGMLGDVLVFKRGTGGHVGLYIAEDSLTYYVLGGNQGNKVSITRIMKDRLLAIRRPPYKNQPASVKPYVLTASGSISNNES